MLKILCFFLKMKLLRNYSKNKCFSSFFVFQNEKLLESKRQQQLYKEFEEKEKEKRLNKIKQQVGIAHNPLIQLYYTLFFL